jgi:inosine/xanthosine triphosphatase
MQKIIVASTNPVKINAVKVAFTRMFPQEKFSVLGITVKSGVSDQPLSDEETYLGAKYRAQNVRKIIPIADYWVGIEGGVEDIGDEMEVFAWIVIISKSGQVTKARTGAFILPDKIAALVRSGKELGEADDIVFGQTNTKQGIGAVGFLTDKIIDREHYYIEAVILALIPFKNKLLYEKN